ncbi:ATP-binding protein [Pseudoalteromonas sp. G4]|uniref:ATP-binding protein n=1 Tax=Pseudoalteromonas sp. G4 TaxID=2992761 RepID=UPI00237E7EFF|nr:ATP-binding protein [Pseudoalteromonas sp. G4]MDE3272681.1 ATP-binding protein [Pseudoalteromonas sp. G4]
MTEGLTLGKRITLFLSIVYIAVLAGLVLFNKQNATQLTKAMLKHEAELIVESIVVATANRISAANFKRITSAIGANDAVDHVLIARANSGIILASNQGELVGESFTSSHFKFSHLLNNLNFNQSADYYYFDKQLIYLTNFEAVSEDRRAVEDMVAILVINTKQLGNYISLSNQYIFFAALFGFSITMALSIYAIRSQAIVPIYQLLNAIRAGIESRKPKKVDLKRSDEIGELVNAYNALIENLLKKQAALKKQTNKSQEAMQAKSDFLAVMSHEIRTPLNGVLGTATLLGKTKMTEQQQQHLDVITSSGQQLLATINDILDISKIEAGKLLLHPVPCEINQMLKNVVDMFNASAMEKDVSIIANYTKQTIYLALDDVRVKQVLINLISNAIKFTEKGTVSVSVDLKSNAPGKHILTITIVDTGIGLSESQIDSLFTKFVQADASTTRKYGGTGLGLAICNALVRQMDGSINVASKLGQGSRFVVTLPCDEAEKPIINTEADCELTRVENANILLVDDVPLNQHIAKAMLASHTITTANNGVEAVAKAKESTFDIILMDCLMPELDGFDATKQIRQMGITTPIVALTASNQSETKDKCLAAGMDDFLSKPLVEKELHNKVNLWAKRHD